METLGNPGSPEESRGEDRKNDKSFEFSKYPTTTVITREELHEQLSVVVERHGYTVETFLATPIDDLEGGEDYYNLRDMWLMAKGLF